MSGLVIGAGEVGTAVHAVLRTAELRDVDADRTIAGRHFDTLHVCIPWSEDFVAIVKGYVDEHTADLVVVHSTVEVGTCDPHGWVHSPIRGRHPHLVAGIHAFTKHFGGARAAEAAVLFDRVGIDVAVHPQAADTEAGKLWELVQYGIQIQVEKAIHAWCEENCVNFDVAYTAMAASYNEGWRALGEERFVRPVLEHIPGPIGGHCVVANARLLDHPLVQLVIQ